MPEYRVSQQLSMSCEDCLYAAFDIATAFRNRGLKVVTTSGKIAGALGGVISAVLGVKCGRYLGEQNVRLICAHTNRYWFVPGDLSARAFVWTVTGTQTNRC